ncbi:MAG: class I SAM-dependent methyltransferase [Proteobacteria bacterium]|nr:class I SAM-dependent methyltransferase [Pseudomonadota bacterium]MBU1687226.1 class I SAM-dependent methyltransferase [Pseudomonadota bacterium]
MTKLDEGSLTGLLQRDVTIRVVEPHILSVFSNDETGNSYDDKFGTMYDLVACNPIYNRLIWGYSTAKFPLVVEKVLQARSDGFVLDIGCGALAFTAGIYSRYRERPVILVDQSLKLLRLAKARLIKLNGAVPENMIFVHADAMQLSFVPKSFSTIIVLNLLHVLPDIVRANSQIKGGISSKNEGTLRQRPLSIREVSLVI